MLVRQAWRFYPEFFWPSRSFAVPALMTFQGYEVESGVLVSSSVRVRGSAM